MQRVRIGLTGLALVFLLVLFGAMIRSASSDEPVPANSLRQGVPTGDSANGQQTEPTEPLAQLGIAPGNADVPNAATGAPPAGK